MLPSLQAYTPLYLAVRSGSVDVLNGTLRQKPDVNEPSLDSLTPLMLAAKTGHSEMVAILLAAGANVNAKQRDGETALHFATRNNNETIVRQLLAAGALPTIYNQKNVTPIYIAVENNYRGIIDAYLSLDMPLPFLELTEYPKGTMPVMAIKRGDVELCQRLLDKGAPYNQSYNEISPLVFAVTAQNLAVVKLILEKYPDPKIILNQQIENNWGMLSFAIAYGSEDIVNYFLEQGADPNMTASADGCTPLGAAILYGHTNTLPRLVAAGASLQTWSKVPKHAPWAIYEPFHLAYNFRGQILPLTSLAVIMRNPDALQFLLRYTSQQQDTESGTMRSGSLYDLAIENHAPLNMVAMLFESGYYQVPTYAQLKHAVDKNSPQLLDILTLYQPNLNEKEDIWGGGQTNLLIGAMRHRLFNAALWLMEHGVNPDEQIRTYLGRESAKDIILGATPDSYNPEAIKILDCGRRKYNEKFNKPNFFNEKKTAEAVICETKLPPKNNCRLM